MNSPSKYCSHDKTAPYYQGIRVSSPSKYCSHEQSLKVLLKVLLRRHCRRLYRLLLPQAVVTGQHRNLLLLLL